MNRTGDVAPSGRVPTYHNICETHTVGKVNKLIKQEDNTLEGLIKEYAVQESPWLAKNAV